MEPITGAILPPLCATVPRVLRSASGKAHRARRIGVPDVIRENVEILGRADEAELKNRAYWYITFHPAIFDECSKVGGNRRVTRVTAQ